MTRSPAPSQTAVEPVAELVERLETDVEYLSARISATLHTIATDISAAASTLTAQAAALVAAEKERDEARDTNRRLHRRAQEAEKAGYRAGRKQARIELWDLLKESIHRGVNDRRRAEAAESEVATLKGRVAELEAGLTPSARTKAALIGEFSFAIDVMEPDADGDDAEVVSREITVPWTTIKEIMSAIRRLTHQEKNNG